MRVVIAEDSALLRAGIERILTDAGHEVVAGVPDATNLLRLVNEKQPDLAIVDVRMPPTFTDEGIRAAALLRSQNPESPVLVLSHYVEERYAAELIASDTKGFGYLLKDRVADVPAFLDAVKAVGGGGTVLDPEVVSQILVRSHRRSGPAGDHAITARPQPGTEGVLGQRGRDELRDVHVREDRTIVPPQASASEPATRQRCTTDEHLVHAAMLAICADNSGASPQGCAQGCG